MLQELIRPEMTAWKSKLPALWECMGLWEMLESFIDMKALKVSCANFNFIVLESHVSSLHIIISPNSNTTFFSWGIDNVTIIIWSLWSHRPLVLCLDMKFMWLVFHSLKNKQYFLIALWYYVPLWWNWRDSTRNSP